MESWSGWNEEVLTPAINERLPELRKAAGNCPACVMAALQQCGIPPHCATDFKYNSELKKVLDNYYWERERDRYP
jgi:hypothetical protein